MEEKVALSPELARQPEMNLTTFYGKVLDSSVAEPILGDTFAAAAARRIDFDFNTLKIPKGASISLPVRAKHLDEWAREFLAAHPSATVLHLGCGLDSRVYRIDPAPSVRWYDIDRPAVVELRRAIYPARLDYELLGASVTDVQWLDAIPTNRVVLVIAEGLSMYLTENDGLALFRRITEQFSTGQFIFDAYSRLTTRMIMFISRLQRSKVSLSWAIDDPRALERQVPRLRLVDAVPFLTMPALVTRLPHTAALRAMTRFAWARRSIQHLRYAF